VNLLRKRGDTAVTIIINSYNTLSAGTSTITKSLLVWLEANSLSENIYIFVPNLKIFEEYQSKGNLKVIKLPVFSGILKYIFRMLYDFILFPFATLIFKSDLSIIIANYSPMKLKGRKIVLMRHSYLVDDSIYCTATLRTRLLELLRRALFKLTISSTKVVIAQSEYMKNLLLEKYDIEENQVHVLPNPVTEVAKLGASFNKSKEETSKNILYISRFYPHKNHDFLLEMVVNNKFIMRKEGVRIYITVNPALGSNARAFLAKLADLQLGDIIINIGEVENQALAEYYKKATCFFFPSRSETFGNPLVEAMSFDLPIVVPDLAYAKAICEEAALYYDPQDSEDAFNSLNSLCQDQNLRMSYSEKSHKQAQKFPTIEQWIKTLFGFNSEHTNKDVN